MSTLTEKDAGGVESSVDFWNLSSKKNGFCDVIEWCHNFSEVSREQNSPVVTRSNHSKFGPHSKNDSGFAASKKISSLLVYKLINHSISQKVENNSFSVDFHSFLNF